jgi:cell surface protein SprA
VGTSFLNNESLNSDVFNQFKENIKTIKERFNNANAGLNYENQSQDVLIPAFIAAYSGNSAKTVGLSPFPSIPLPNWRLDYNGLNKISALKDIFTSVTLSHAYTSSYSVSNYSNSLAYTTPDNKLRDQLLINNPVENYNTSLFANTTSSTSGQLIPVYIISQVMINETFAPLIGISAKTKSKLSITFNYKTKRDISLNVPNAQITEVNGKDWSFELGFTKNNMRLPFKDKGRIITLKNDVTFRMTFGVTSNQTIQRRIDEGSTITNGNINFQLRPNLSYVVNKKLTLQMYVEHTTNEPLVSNSYNRTTTKGGFKVVFNLSQ